MKYQTLRQMLKDERKSKKAIEDKFLKLLTVIHHDGGRYTAEYGVTKSFVMALDIINQERNKAILK